MNQKLWTALLVPFAFSLAVLPVEAESIPIHRKSAISVQAPEEGVSACAEKG